MAKVFNTFLHFPSDSFVDKISSKEDLESFISSITLLIDRVDCEKGVKLYYEGTNLDAFVEHLDLIKEIGEIEKVSNFGTLSPRAALNRLLRKTKAKNWEEKPKHDISQSCLYRLWYFDGRRLYDEFPEVLKEIAEHSLRIGDEEICLWLNMEQKFDIKQAPELAQEILPVFKDCRENKDLPVFLYITQISTFEELDIWFEKHRKPRAYNMEDNRHVETHPDYRKKHQKSPLLGGLGGKQNLADLLQTAVGDQRENKDLMNYDPIHKRYVWFEYEEDNPQNQYHGYHLAIPTIKAKHSGDRLNAHDRDTEAEARIPTRVKDILRHRLGDQFPD